jgi:formamidopyrimidine-DNA glycosylase
MPELPEVQTVVNGLNKEVLGRTFLDFWTDTPNVLRNIERRDFERRIKGTSILKANRRAKNILISLSSGDTLLIHLKMTGHILLGDWKMDKISGKWESLIEGPMKDDPYNRFIRAMFFLDDGRKMGLCDMRKFAKIELWDEKGLKGALEGIGPEPLENSFSFQDFVMISEKKRGKIKQVLMDQRFIAGIGNIYASEILFESRIHPEEDISDLEKDDLRRIYDAMKSILARAIKTGGDSFSDFRNVYGERGKFQDLMKVYGKEGHLCPDCDNQVEKSKLGGRGTFYCPRCQKKRK